MWRVLALLLLIDTGCETCGPPAEPLLDFTATIEVTPAANDHVHASMFNARGEYVNSMTTSVQSLDGAPWSYTLGDCDGTPQESGTFTVYAWLEPSSDRTVQLPGVGVPHGIDMIDVDCTDGCYAVRPARITIR